MRRVRASFLLRCVILAGNLGALVGFFLLGNSIGWSLGFLIFLVVFWFIAIEMDLLAMMIERILTRLAAASAEPVESIWFVDLDLEAKRERDNFEQETRKNPTIR